MNKLFDGFCIFDFVTDVGCPSFVSFNNTVIFLIAASAMPISVRTEVVFKKQYVLFVQNRSSILSRYIASLTFI